MFRKIVTALIVVPLAVVIVAFAVANRQAVTVSFDPFDSAHPAYAMTLPLFVIVFALLIVGVIVGGIAAWLRQSAWRRTARRLDVEVRQLHNEVTRLQAMINAAAPDRSAKPPGQQTPVPLLAQSMRQ